MRYVNPLLFVLLVVIGIKLTDSAYKWARYGPEREQVKRMRAQLVDAGASIVRTRQASDSMRAVLRAEDEALEREQRALRRYDDYAHDGALPTGLYERYRAELTRYNEHVASRNARLSEWQDVLERNHTVVSRYHLLSDSIRDLATRMGDPYYEVPTPAEAAIERGVIKPERAANP
ncbi:MAG TPA: hypothetical protein VFJ82_18375 [Longimicrobium sp.]|nr:hypothetical protein [Longimicrobium sp.]